MQAVLELGAWSCFENCHVLSSTVLAFMSGVVLDIRKALGSNAEKLRIGHVDVSLDHLTSHLDPDAVPIAFFINLPCDASLTGLPPRRARDVADFVTWHTRRVTLLPTCLVVLFEAVFRCD